MGQSCTAKLRRACPGRSRRDGWSAERQLHFLDALVQTRSVTRAAAAAGMSRESAYRLRNRGEGLFALLWDRALAADITAGEGHSGALANGRLLRLLGIHFRRQSGDFSAIGSTRTGACPK
jgi:hypothetical protein